ncbi:MAG: hypothetical protein ACLKAN_13335 [Alkaliphilus sp.]
MKTRLSEDSRKELQKYIDLLRIKESIEKTDDEASEEGWEID